MHVNLMLIWPVIINGLFFTSEEVKTFNVWSYQKVSKNYLTYGKIYLFDLALNFINKLWVV